MTSPSTPDSRTAPSGSRSARFLLTLAFTCSLVTPAQAQNREIELSSLRTAGTQLSGVSAGDFAGRSVAGAGDVNGDGIDDLLVSAWTTGLFAPPGSVYLIYGSAWSPPSSLNLAAADVLLTGVQNGSRTGSSLGAAGDVNGDGFDDFLIGADGYDVNGPNADSGRVYLVYGGAGLPASLSLGSLALGAGVVFEGATSGDLMGTSVAGVGDVNGDSVPDILIGGSGVNPGGKIQAGQAVLVYGSTSFADSVDLASLGASEGVTINGGAATDHAGHAVAAAGHFNGDGFRDLLIGALDADGNSADSGIAYVVYGAASLPSSIDLGSLGAAGLTLQGDQPGDALGVSVSGGGDINGDGFDDIILGSHQYDDTANNEGRAFIVYGSASPPASLDTSALGTAGVTLTGIDNQDEAGFQVAMGGATGVATGGAAEGGPGRKTPGDMNGDGFADVLVSARQADPNGSASGEVYLLHGNQSLPSSVGLESLSFRGVQLNGQAANQRAGDSLAFVGDFNDDGFEDWAVGSRFANSNTGEVHVVQGACNMLNANGPTGEGQTFTLTAHGTPQRLSLLFFSAFVLPEPLDTGVGPFWLGNPFQAWQIKQLDANGQWNVNITVPAGIGLSGLTVYYQLYEDPVFPFCSISQLLATPIP